jgi:muramidase (phage lysozyme)
MIPQAKISKAPDTYRGHTAKWWAHRATMRKTQRNVLQKRLVKRVLQIRKMRRITLSQPDARTAIEIASKVYGVSYSELMCKAYRESKFYAYAKNKSSTASGMFQFLDSTWASTPFGRYSVFNGWINALAAGWMHHVGRGGEWSTC